MPAAPSWARISVRHFMLNQYSSCVLQLASLVCHCYILFYFRLCYSRCCDCLSLTHWYLFNSPVLYWCSCQSDVDILSHKRQSQVVSRSFGVNEVLVFFDIYLFFIIFCYLKWFEVIWRICYLKCWKWMRVINLHFLLFVVAADRLVTRMTVYSWWWRGV
jgi:hypothetical protein